jgi:hypothetical protein
MNEEDRYWDEIGDRLIAALTDAPDIAGGIGTGKKTGPLSVPIASDGTCLFVTKYSD